MRVLGIDPGSQITGYGIVDFLKNQATYIASGVIKLDQDSFPEKLHFLYRQLSGIIQTNRPSAVSLENIFFSHNVRSALKLGHTRGAIIINALEHKLPVVEFTPKEMKMAVVGNGNASKQQVRYMIMKMLRLEKNLSLDESDALGLAVCCVHRAKSSPAQYRHWKDFIKAHPELVIK